ncbi:hypothetical protein D3C81_1524310 [compost metagenome]
MHLLGGAGDGIDRACLDAKGAADAQALVDQRDRARLLGAALGIERHGFDAERPSQPAHPFRAARRAAVAGRFAGGHGLGVGAAAVESAFGALGLGQQRLDAVGKGLDGGIHGNRLEFRRQTGSGQDWTLMGWHCAGLAT